MRIIPHPTKKGSYYLDIAGNKANGGKRERIPCATYDEALKLKATLEAPTAAKKQTVHPKIGEVVDAYLEWVKENQSEVTHHNKEIRFRRWITPFFAQYRVKDISQTLLDRYAAGKKKTCYLTDLVFLLALIRWMVKRKLANKLDFDPEFPKVQRQVKSIPEPADFLKFIAAIPVEMHRVMAQMMLFTAMRIKEVRMLRWEEYNGTAFICRHTKTQQQYLQPLPESLLPWFEEYKKSQGWVFTFNGRKPVCDIFHSLKQASVETGIKINAHLFRHAAATFTYEQTNDLYAVQMLLRHSTPKQSTIYTRFAAHRRSASVNALESLINNSGQLSGHDNGLQK